MDLAGKDNCEAARDFRKYDASAPSGGRECSCPNHTHSRPFSPRSSASMAPAHAATCAVRDRMVPPGLIHDL